MAKKEKKVKVKKVKEAKPKKTKQRERGESVNFNELLANHFEKGLLGLALLLTLLIVWSGFRGRQGIELNKTPATLDREVAETEKLVNQFNWEADFRAARVDNQDFPTRADKALRPLDPQVYATNQLIRPPVSPPLTKRKDPDLFAATDLQVRAGFGILEKSTSRGGPDRPGAQEPDIFSTGNLDDEEVDEKSGRPMPGSGMVGDRRGRGGETEGIYFASVTALVPVRQQLENYQSNLANSRGQDESRDVPIYTNWILERSEVDSSGNDLGYEQIAEGRARRGRRDGSDSMDRVMSRDGTPEAVHPQFRHPLLTQSVPHVEVRDPNRLFVHDRIVALSQKAYQKERERRDARRRGRGSRRGRQLDGDRQGSGIYRDDSGMDRMDPYMDSQGPGEVSRYQGRGQGTEQAPDTGLKAGMPLDKAPEYYMFRYVDRNVEVGRTYRYRLQLVLDDPNNSRYNKPSPETLEPAVAARVIGSQSTNRETQFSAESAAVEILPGQQLLLAKTNPVPRTIIRERQQSFPRPGSYPTAEVMALIFDASRSTDIPGTAQVSPGAAVCFAADTEIPLWDRSWLKKEKDFEFRTDFEVLDIRGGEEAEKSKLITKPGEALVRDPAGRITVIRELNDEELIAKYTFPKEEPERREGGLDDGRGGGRSDGTGREGGRNPRGRGRDQ